MKVEQTTAELPTFKNRQLFLKGLQLIYSWWKGDSETKEMLAVSLLTKNSVTLLSGTYGTGKSTFIESVMKVFFSDVFSKEVKPVARIRDTLTEFDVLLYVDIAKLRQGIEQVDPRPIVTESFKFFNELQRGNLRLYNALLSLFAEKEVEYRGRVFKSKPFVAFCDRNPHDVSSHEIPKALWDRLDAHLYIKVLEVTENYELLNQKYVLTRTQRIIDALPKLMTSEDMMEIWEDVEKVVVPQSITLFLALLGAAFTCVRVDRSVTEPKYRLPCDGCQYKGELCYKVKEVWGVRWMESTIRFAKARAWLYGRPMVQLEDVFFVLPYTLNHRLVLRPEVESSYPNKIVFVRNVVIEEVVKRIKAPIWVQAIKAYVEAQKGNKDAERRLEELAERDVVVMKLWKKYEEENKQGMNGFEKLLMGDVQ
ncbi:MAG: AAA family ATPase [Deltaproteobacteria bacterium]|nr:AAA family ATPase [Deltaproteobacteria bacterium]